MLSDYKMDSAKHSKIPMDVGYIKSHESESKLLPNNNDYRRIVGSLLYLTVNTRPDISVAVSILSRKICNPTEQDLTELKRILKYLSSTKDLKLKVGNNLPESETILEGYADADWAGDVKTRKSTSGYIFKLGGATLSWASRKQGNVTLSSTEAEYVALSEACQEIKWLKILFEDFNIKILKAVIKEDNQSCLKLAADKEKINPRTKHVDVKYHHVRDMYEEGEIELEYCSTEHMVADILTKPLTCVKFGYLRRLLGLQ